MTIDLNIEEIETLLASLAMAASRREAQANAVKFGRHHDEAAQRMRRLHVRLLRMKVAGGPSVQCPHCKWGFDPSVIDQHVREKHENGDV